MRTDLKIVMKLLVLAGLCLAYPVGCAWQRLAFIEPGDTVAHNETIHDTMQRWMRHVQKHDRWSTILDVDAIFLSWEVRQAILERTLSDRPVDAETAAAMREREQQMFEGYIEFYLAVMTTQDEWNNLAAEEPAWNIFFVDDDGAEYPSFRVEEVELDPALQFTHFPLRSNFKTFYRVSFIRNPKESELPLLHKETHFFGLLFKGYFGQAHLTWKLD